MVNRRDSLFWFRSSLFAALSCISLTTVSLCKPNFEDFNAWLLNYASYDKSQLFKDKGITSFYQLLQCGAFTNNNPVVLFIDEIQYIYGSEKAQGLWDVLKRIQGKDKAFNVQAVIGLSVFAPSEGDKEVAFTAYDFQSPTHTTFNDDHNFSPNYIYFRESETLDLLNFFNETNPSGLVIEKDVILDIHRRTNGLCGFVARIAQELSHTFSGRAAKVTMREWGTFSAHNLVHCVRNSRTCETLLHFLQREDTKILLMRIVREGSLPILLDKAVQDLVKGGIIYQMPGSSDDKLVLNSEILRIVILKYLAPKDNLPLGLLFTNILDLLTVSIPLLVSDWIKNSGSTLTSNGIPKQEVWSTNFFFVMRSLFPRCYQFDPQFSVSRDSKEGSSNTKKQKKQKMGRVDWLISSDNQSDSVVPVWWALEFLISDFKTKPNTVEANLLEHLTRFTPGGKYGSLWDGRGPSYEGAVINISNNVVDLKMPDNVNAKLYQLVPTNPGYTTFDLHIYPENICVKLESGKPKLTNPNTGMLEDFTLQGLANPVFGFLPEQKIIFAVMYNEKIRRTRVSPDITLREALTLFTGANFEGLQFVLKYTYSENEDKPALDYEAVLDTKLSEYADVKDFFVLEFLNEPPTTFKW
eukprot:TRINITY_DN4610_c0_g1_i3.p1 TRINITY_DN4610_c0_g1~~TRINITY_DN4610_c0_g1_i3.p1  ORF type:complete len:638 (+),score=75.34 TRINITY_DN4610_c0_g1_i3:195-2108(+)